MKMKKERGKVEKTLLHFNTIMHYAGSSADVGPSPLNEFLFSSCNFWWTFLFATHKGSHDACKSLFDVPLSPKNRYQFP